MNPDLAVVSTVQAAITSMLLTSEPEFIRWGQRVFLSFAVAVIAWEFLKVALGQGGPFDIAKMLLSIAFGYAMIQFYDVPIPGVGVSFTNLITDQTAHFAGLLDTRSLATAYGYFNDVWSRFVVPDGWSPAPLLIYFALWLVVALAQAAMVFVVSFGMIASAVIALFGPIFVPFYIVPQLEWLFWGWLKSFLQYSFIHVVALGVLMVAQQLIGRLATQMPATVTVDLYPLYGFQVLIIAIDILFVMLAVPLVTSSLFSGHSHHAGTTLATTVVRRGR